MRMRFKPYARPELLACDFHVHEPLTHGGHWHELYARPDQPWHLELGCGKGGFLAQIAPAHPDINYLGIDITDKVLILAKRKVEAAYAERGIPADNVKSPAWTLSAWAMPSHQTTVFRASTSISATRGARTPAAISTA